MTHAVALQKLNHVAWRCRDAEQTRHFYEDLLGLPLAHTVQADKVPSTGEDSPYFHIFFELADGSYIAFFDICDGKGAEQVPDMPSWLHHFAFEVSDLAQVHAMKARLEAAGIEVVGVTDHGFIQSIYFFDPNGLRLEVTARSHTASYMEKARVPAREALAKWTASKRVAAH